MVDTLYQLTIGTKKSTTNAPVPTQLRQKLISDSIRVNQNLYINVLFCIEMLEMRSC